MAQNISILEGGTAQQFGQVNKLKIANSGGGTSLWVPEDEVNTKSLHVDSNGTYYASQDECYGYDEVSVNIVDECFGYDDDGNLWDVEVDDDDFLEEEEMPVRIEVTTPPTKTTYIVGEPINTAGMVVKAYYSNGEEYGTLDRSDYSISPLVAIKTGTGSATSDISSIQSLMPIPYAMQVTTDSSTYTLDYNGPSYDLMTSHLRLYAGYLGVLWASRTRKDPYDYSFTYKGQTAYATHLGIMNTQYNPSPVVRGWEWDDPNNYAGAVAWTMLYGDGGGGIFESVTVSWTIPDTSIVLTAMFDITVNDPPSPISGDSGSGSSSGGSSGGEDPEHPITPHI